jgi:hypothetical protein
MLDPATAATAVLWVIHSITLFAVPAATGMTGSTAAMTGDACPNPDREVILLQRVDTISLQACLHVVIAWLPEAQVIAQMNCE